ncbi:MAG TPA: hypothetical protein VHB79_13320 [Polyangiaceae bacterium]|nr:hypothetical protein [Polyangiaceae bacterium]
MSPTKKASKTTTGKRRSVAPSAPEVKLTYANAGRDTMAAIEEELAAPSLSTAEAPVIEISETPAGRETMAAIAEELADAMRPRMNTLPYEDKIKNAPGARSPSKMPAPRDTAPPAEPVATAHDDGPEVTVTTSHLEAPPPTPRQAPEELEIFELLTFIIRGNKVGDLSTDALRRRFVQEHLLHRVPSGSIDAVERIEVTPWTAKGTMVVRVWCRA